jgi:hypothetical protein
MIMGREVRMVSKDYEHEKSHDGIFKPKYEFKDYKRRLDDFMEKLNSVGMQEALEWCGNPPNLEDYMPDFGDSATHYMMFEDTSEGTPISPAFSTPEELAQWLVDNKASAFAGHTADYEHWLKVAKGAYALSAVMDSNGMHSGVMAL